jgi:hypothetical protein
MFKKTLISNYTYPRKHTQNNQINKYLKFFFIENCFTSLKKLKNPLQKKSSRFKIL